MFDVIIIGAGPSGSSAAISLKNSGLKVAIFDKDIFPRAKTCGDALSLDVINQFHRMSPEIVENFTQLPQKKSIDGISVMSPNCNSAVFSIEHTGKQGFVVPRIDFDNFFFNQAKKCKNITAFEGTKIVDYEFFDDFVQIKTGEGKLYKAKIILGANGAYSNITRKVAGIKPNKKHYSLAVQAYFENVPFENENLLELYYPKETLPGYLWIFPTHDGLANVGLGLMANRVRKEKINLEKLLLEILQKPEFKERFINSKLKTKIKSYGLPLGSRKLNISGNRYLLLGDAASLIDPLLGEGIGNAIRSGRFAAEHIVNCFEKNNFSAEFNKSYDKKIYKSIWKEQKRYLFIQKAFKYPMIINWSIKKVKKSNLVSRFFGDSVKVKQNSGL
ncbi:MAG: geranylgeranyl reductase family protein [Bacteroidales bacterium]|nr:geranylgeranyl reductase family protein [Bacteroidales bacterium]